MPLQKRKMANFTRRQFIDISKSTILGSAIAATTAPILGRQKEAYAASSDADSNRDRVVHTYCDVCFMGCGINVSVRRGRAVKIEGNPAHPISRGKLCPRGTAGLGQLYDPNRLKTPLIRTRRFGMQHYASVSWEEALNYMADKMNAIRQDYGPEALALFKHGKGGTPWVELWHAMGSKTEGHPSYAQCRGARDVGWALTFGKGPGSVERIGLDKAKVVAFIGAHLGENMHNVTVQDFTAGLRKGARNIVVDPRFSTIAGKAKYWLAIKPGTDIALLLAWMHVLIYENLYDREFVRRYTIGFDRLKEHVQYTTPEWAAAYTSLPAVAIRESARELGNAIPDAVLYPGRRFAWYGDDTQRARAMAIINALLGCWGRESGIFLGDRFHIPKFKKKYPYYQKAKAAFNYKDKYPLATSIPTQDLIHASIPGMYDPTTTDSLIKGWVIYGTNLLYSVPNPQLIEQAAQHLDLLVVIDTMPSEITGLADVVLPDTTYLERYDPLNSPEWREPFVSIRQPVVKPLYDSRPSWWIAERLSYKLYLEEFFLYNDYKQVIESQLRALGSSIDDINRKGGVLKKPYSMPEMKFRTPSGKVELYSRQLADAGYDPLPKFTEQDFIPDAYFRLLYGRAPQHTFSRTTNNAQLLEVFPENTVWVNRVIAELFNLQEEEYVILVNQKGIRSNRVKVRLTSRIRQDCVYLVHGFGHRDRRLARGFGQGADVNGLLSDYVTDPISGATGSQVNFVTFVK